jgi:hypothetical protein
MKPDDVDVDPQYMIHEHPRTIMLNLVSIELMPS